MSRIDVAAAVNEFRTRLEDDYYPVDRVKKKATGYSNEIESRDTQAVKDFHNTALFEYIKNLK